MLPFSGVASLRFDFLRVGSLRDAFLRVTLERYQQELGKDFKRITLYICTKSDYYLHECGGYLEDEEPDKGKCVDVDNFENVVVTDDSDFEQPGTSGHSSEKHSYVKDHEEPNSAQIKSDHDMALALLKSINKEDDEEGTYVPCYLPQMMLGLALLCLTPHQS